MSSALCPMCGINPKGVLKSGKLDSYCVSCKTIRFRRWVEANRERHKENSTRWRIEHASEHNERRRQYYQRNREKIRLLERQKYAKNVEHERVLAAEYRHRNAEKVRAWKRAEYARNCEKYHEYSRQKRLDPVYLERERRKRKNHFFRAHSQRLQRRTGIWLAPIALWGLWKHQRGRCALTGRLLEPRKEHAVALDHIVPIVDGGVSTIENLRWLCFMANVAKHTFSDSELIELCRDIGQKNWHPGSIGSYESSPC